MRFTLVELMIVVAIIGILASIAIPNFHSMQLRSKSSEVSLVLTGLGDSVVAYSIDNDGSVPAAGGYNPNITPGKTKNAWNTGLTAANLTTWNSLAFSPDGEVYGQYGYASVAGFCPYDVDIFTYSAMDVDGDLTLNYTYCCATGGPVIIVSGSLEDIAGGCKDLVGQIY